MKGHGKFGQKLNPAFQISPKQISQFVWSGWKGSKLQMLLLSFVWKVNSFNQKPSQEFYFVTLKGHGKFGLKLNPAFQISPKKLAQFVSSGQKLSNFHILLLSFMWKANPSSKNLNRGFILWHWRAMESLGKNWILLSKSAPKKLVNLFGVGEKGPNFKCYCSLLSER